jgi:IS5 family transposase
MRQERPIQAQIFEVFARHQIGCKLKAISDWLDRQRALLGLVASDLRREGLRPTGRRGLPAETVLRCALLKQQRQLSYEELAFHLEDSASFRAFARLPRTDQCDSLPDLGGCQLRAGRQCQTGKT